MLTSATQTRVRTTDSASTAWASISATVLTPSPAETARDVSNMHSLSNTPVVRFSAPPPHATNSLNERLNNVYIVAASTKDIGSRCAALVPSSYHCAIVYDVSPCCCSVRCAGCTQTADVVLVLDASGSMEAYYDWQMQLAKEIVYNLNFANSRTRVAVVTYSTTPAVRFYLDQYFDRESVLNAVSFLQENGRTGTAAALRLTASDVFTQTRGDRAGADNVVIVMTDGRSNVNEADTIPSATALKNNNVRVISVGVGNAYDLQELNGMASSPESSNVFIVDSEAAIQSATSSIMDELCQ